MRKINKIIIHCSDTSNGKHINAEDIHRWHTSPSHNFDMIGYHYVVNIDGNVEHGRPEWMAGAHCKGHNDDSIGICLIGRDEFSEEQYAWLKILIEELLVRHKDATVHGHYEFSTLKTCPNFNVGEWFENYDDDDLNLEASVANYDRIKQMQESIKGAIKLLKKMVK